MTRLAWALCGLGIAGAAALVLLDVLDASVIRTLDEAQPAGIVLGVSFSLLGAVIVHRRPENRIGWIYLGIGVLMPLPGIAALYYARSAAVGGLPGARWAAWFDDWGSVLIFPTGLSLFAFLLFPDGRLPSSRWRWLGRVAVLTAAAEAVLTWLDPARITVLENLPTASSPTGVSAFGTSLASAGNDVFLFGLALDGLAIGTLVWRARRGSETERRQVKALAYAAAVTMLAILLLTIAAVSGAGVSASAWDVPVVLGFGVAIPIACGLAIVRHGLYDIDRLISRTISYLVLTGILVGVFAGIVVLVTDVLPFSSPVGVAASTLAAAALFNPLRRRLQGAVDRRFNRARYDAEETLAAFSLRLRQAVALEAVEAGLLESLGAAVQPSHVSVWLRPSG